MKKSVRFRNLSEGSPRHSQSEYRPGVSGTPAGDYLAFLRPRPSMVPNYKSLENDFDAINWSDVEDQNGKKG